MTTQPDNDASATPCDTPTPDGSEVAADDGAPSLRQVLHAATGDRVAEAKALVDKSDGTIDDGDALVAVRQAHGDLAGGVAGPDNDSDIANAQNAAAVAADRKGSD